MEAEEVESQCEEAEMANVSIAKEANHYQKTQLHDKKCLTKRWKAIGSKGVTKILVSPSFYIKTRILQLRKDSMMSLIATSRRLKQLKM